MHILLKTNVNQPLSVVWSGFDKTLFDQLSPPFPPVRVVRFDGCQPGDSVQLELNFIFFRQDWISRIVDQQTTESEIYFVDQGVKLPFFLAHWHHRHRLLRDPSGATVIVDDIHFRTPLLIADFLLYPVMWLLFAYRRPIYRRIFK